MGQRDIIAIGGSLGAVQEVRRLCSALPADLAATMCIVVHIGARGNNLLAEVFNARAPITVRTARDGDRLQRGFAYVAPADHHLLVLDDVIRLGRGPRENMARPAIDPLLRSVGISYGPRAVGVVLTGLLNDGAAGLADMKRCGSVTVVQNPADAEAPDMPYGALRASDVDYRAPLADMPALLMRLIAEEAVPTPEVPDDVRLEVEIALGRPSDAATMIKLADPVPMSCPSCGGVLSQIRHWPPLRFRCQIGHAYTADILAEQTEGSVDEALRTALRIIEERVVLIIKMMEDARRSGLNAAAQSYEERARECQAQAEVLRKAISQTS
jgi:two-component system chemotaxis response regulator CheB